jgi:predicted O-methyltransferase YrrM
VYSKFQLAFKYFQYYLSSSNGKGHGIHSPFVFEFITKVLNEKKDFAEYEAIEGLRKKLLTDKSVIEVEDFGAGSGIDKTNQRTISSIAKNSVKQKKFGQLLFRVVKYYRPKNILELGTSLGITTSYLAVANPDSKVITLEGSKSIQKKARENFESLKLENIQVVEGNFKDTLPTVMQSLSSIDLAFIDGNHQKEPTERYFRQILDKVHNDSILIFDDIHWSGEMEEAWKTIQQDEQVRCTIDLFFMGIVFFRQEFKEKQHFKIRF